MFIKVKKMNENKFIEAICGAGLTNSGGQELDLTEGEQRTLFARYSRGKSIDTEKFLEDIKKRNKFLSEVSSISQSMNKDFTNSQIFLLDKLKQWMGATKCGVQMVIEFKRFDEQN